ncbi:hypothetical protein [Glaciimonas sp. PAMC28666]|uniref:hypothetical protein n=1 Tax=Glaciimonas sp. PAMC28666 TaxID=2807626 RepID=UPI00196597A7|nr:hypothetical protein [Glaciimonas sp. PAMC28666]QRX81844.1 hypothetical protein JQN73_17120 [Glaciimonas sp. PAMC28666]
MKYLDILLPFGLPPAELTRDILRELKLPALSTLVARANGGSQRRTVLDEFSRALPHETWLSQHFGLSVSSAPNANKPDNPTSSPPIAVAAMHAFGLSAADGHWFMLQPAHIHIARDHLVLTDIRQVTLTEEAARALFDEAKPLFDGENRTLCYGDAKTWFMRADDWQHLNTSTPDAACGHNVDIWMPQGEGARAWRKLQNEVQMQWFENGVNEQRAASRQQAVNALWLWGGASAEATNALQAPRYSHAFNLHGWARGFGQALPADANVSANVNAEKLIGTSGEHGFLLLDHLIAPALTGEWSEWIQAFQAMERDWFAPLLQALQQGKLKQLALTFTDNTRITELTTTPLSLKKFWVKPSLNATFAAPAEEPIQ